MRNSSTFGLICIFFVLLTSCKKDCLDQCRAELNSFSVVENTSFEEWTPSKNLTYEELNPVDQWVSLNPISERPADVERAPITVFRVNEDSSTNATIDGSAVKITTGKFAPLAGVGPLPTEGILAIGQLRNDGVDLENPILYGHNYSQKIVGVSGQFKYLPVENDSAFIILRGINYLNCSCNEDTLFFKKLSIQETTEEWTPFELKLDTYDGLADGVSIIFSSSGAPNDLQGNEGSTLFVDELEVNYAE